MINTTPPPVPPPRRAPASPPAAPKRMGTGLKVLVGAGIGCGAVVVLSLVGLMIAFVALGMGIESGRVPDAMALPAGKIPPATTEKLRDLGIVDPDEKVLYFYSAALLSIENDGNLFTDRRVISYQQGDGGLEVYAATFDEIENIEFLDSESWVDDSTISIYTSDGAWFILRVSASGQRDDDFYAKLKRRWERGGVQQAQAGGAQGG